MLMADKDSAEVQSPGWVLTCCQDQITAVRQLSRREGTDRGAAELPRTRVKRAAPSLVSCHSTAARALLYAGNPKWQLLARLSRPEAGAPILPGQDGRDVGPGPWTVTDRRASFRAVSWGKQWLAQLLRALSMTATNEYCARRRWTT